MRPLTKAASLGAIGRPASRERARAVPGSLGTAGRFALLASVLGLAALLPVIQSSSVTTAGYRVRQLQQENARQEAEVAALEAEVARLSSRERIEQRARDLGMVPVQDPLYIEVDAPGPGALHVPRRYTPPPPTAEPADRSWWEPLLDAVRFW
ncbi:MAG TPA: septum formation initiator family protein [Dehalococcoidia bacterium]